MTKINKSLQDRRKIWTPNQQTGEGRSRRWRAAKGPTKKKRNTHKISVSKKSKKKSKKKKR